MEYNIGETAKVLLLQLYPAVKCVDSVVQQVKQCLSMPNCGLGYGTGSLVGTLPLPRLSAFQTAMNCVVKESLLARIIQVGG